MLRGETVFAPLFDAVVFSCFVGKRKPDPALYLKACRELGVASGECLYVGDSGSRELSGAAAVGMKPFLLHDNDEQDNPDTHRVDGEAWKGPMISDLTEILRYLKEE